MLHGIDDWEEHANERANKLFAAIRARHWKSAFYLCRLLVNILQILANSYDTKSNRSGVAQKSQRSNAEIADTCCKCHKRIADDETMIVTHNDVINLTSCYCTSCWYKAMKSQLDVVPSKFGGQNE